MGMSSIETPLLGDNNAESNVSARMSRGNEVFVALPSSWTEKVAVESREAVGCGIQWRSQSGVVLVTICCIAAILFSSASFVSYQWRLQAGDRLVEKTIRGDGLSEFYTASRTSFHFQPPKNFMGDPCGPLFHNGYYHFFYQWNPSGSLWDTPSWGHAVSKDLIHWKHVDVSIGPDHWYDHEGTWSGAVTVLQDGTPVIIYTGGHRNKYDLGLSDQTQNLAVAVDPSDPLLRKWKKVDGNPILYNPGFVRTTDFRDPSGGWQEDDGLWRMTIGSMRNNSDDDRQKDGMALMYTSTDFFHWNLEETFIHLVNGTGIWECVDLYPVLLEGNRGLNHSVLRAGNSVDSYKYVLKVSINDKWEDMYTVGTYSTETHTFTPDDPAIDVGIGLRLDYGKFYGSRSFFDSSTGRRILWGYANESDSVDDRLIKGWSCVQGIPREIWLDRLVPGYVKTWPVEEVEALRGAKASYQNVELQPADVMKVVGGDGPQLDILVVFEKPDVSSVENVPSDPVPFDCGRQSSAAARGLFGPFGLLVHTHEHLIEQTAIFFYISYLKDEGWATVACNDHSRSSLAPEVDLGNFGGYLKILTTENELSLRILVDHSIVETFVQGGRIAITSRSYPMAALGSRAHTFLFNNGTTPILVKSLDVYQMGSVNMTSI